MTSDHEPMAAEIEAHERYLRLQDDLNAAVEAGDRREAGRLKPLVERARREWHRLVREAEDAMRTKRPR
jgi:hypothetical protein